MNFHALFVKFLILSCVAIGSAICHAQSTSQSFPTPITTNEISGTIKARDIGDGRITTYYYAFDGEQGDIFLNLVSKNFNGDIDVFLLEGVQPLTKMVIYSDLSENETGRVIYLRKPEKLLLRVQGRSPNDDPASFRIKFAGSFVALKASDGITEPVLPQIRVENETGIRVNSVGTIIEAPPVAPPARKESVAVAAKDDAEKPAEPVEALEPKKKLEVVVSDELPTKEKTPSRKRTRTPAAKTRTKKPVKTAAKIVTPDETPATEPAGEVPVRKATPKTRAKKTAKEKLPDPLENIRLVVLFKDGKTIERPMSEVFKFSVDKGVLTIIHKDGSIGRYSIFDVAKVTIE